MQICARGVSSVKQGESGFVCSGEDGCQGDDQKAGAAYGKPGGGEAGAVQQAAQKQVADAGKGAADGGRKGMNPAPVGSRDPAGHVGLTAQGGEHLTQGEKGHQEEAQCQLELGIAVAVKAQNNEGLANEDLLHIPEPAQEGGHKGCGKDHHQGIDTGEQAEDLRTLGTVQRLHVQRKQIVELGIDKAAEASQKGVENQSLSLPENGQQTVSLAALFVLADMDFFHLQTLDKQDDQQGGGEGCRCGNEESQPQVVFKEEASQCRCQHQPQVCAKVLETICLFPAFAVAEIRNQGIIGGPFNGGEHTGNVKQHNAGIGQGDQACNDIAQHGDQVTHHDNMLSVPAVSQLAPQKQHGKLDNAHDHGNERNGRCAVAQLVFQDQGHQGPDQRAHAGDDAAPEKHIDLPGQISVLSDKFFDSIHFLKFSPPFASGRISFSKGTTG